MTEDNPEGRGAEHASSSADFSGNPVAKGLNVTVSVPQTVEVRMVDAAALADYEILFFISSILGSAVVGFSIAFLQENEPKSQRLLAYFTCVLSALFLIFVGWTLRKRYLLTRRSKTVRIQYAQVEQKPKRKQRAGSQRKPPATTTSPAAPASEEGSVEHTPGTDQERTTDPSEHDNPRS